MKLLLQAKGEVEMEAGQFLKDLEVFEKRIEIIF